MFLASRCPPVSLNSSADPDVLVTASTSPPCCGMPSRRTARPSAPVAAHAAAAVPRALLACSHNGPVTRHLRSRDPSDVHSIASAFLMTSDGSSVSATRRFGTVSADARQ